MSPRDLPIYELEAALVSAAADGGRIIVQAPTGSGKSTQVPQMLLNHGLLGERGEVVVLQPRRMAARLLARRVAEETGSVLGRLVGYQIRLESRVSEMTRIRFVTEGILLRQMSFAANLPGIGAIIFDEFHERHLYGDISLARAVQIQRTIRPDLKLLVMSATLDSGALREYLAPCRVLISQGRSFPVRIEYLAKPVSFEVEPVWEVAARECERMVEATRGDLLVFMPGGYEIARTVQALQESRSIRGCIILPLHGELSTEAQDRAVARYEARKIIVSTNVAETSLTIDGVTAIVDSGLARIARFDPHRGINTLLVEKISIASADQRAGRAGRTAPGVCLRLWTEREQAQRPAQELPEVKRLDLSEVVLALKASGIEDVFNFGWLERPDPKSLERAETLLADLGALDKGAADGSKGRAGPLGPPAGLGGPSGPALPAEALRITELGRKMMRFPAHPRYARMFLAAEERGCVRSVALMAALTQGRNFLLRNVSREIAQAREELFGEEEESDFFLLMRAWRYADKINYSLDACRRLGLHAQSARQVGPLYEQFMEIARGEGLDVSEAAQVLPPPVAGPTVALAPGRSPGPEAGLPATSHRGFASLTPSSNLLGSGARARSAGGTGASAPPISTSVRKCVLAGFSDQLAKRLDAGTLRCELVHRRRGMLARESAVQKARIFVAAEITEIGGQAGEVSVLLNLATAVEESWLRELFPGDFREEREVVYDEESKRVVARREKRFRDLILEVKAKSEDVPLDAAARLLAREVLAGRIKIDAWDESVEQWIIRVNRLAEWFPELEVNPLGEADRATLIEQICYGELGARAVREKEVMPFLRDWLTREQLAAMEECVPERLVMGNGRRSKVTYSKDGPPILSARIQELYGVEGKFALGRGRVPVKIEVLAPNQRPIQVTDDLTTFWREVYPKVKAELSRKYPRHEWR